MSTYHGLIRGGGSYIASVPFWRVTLRKCCHTQGFTSEVLPKQKRPFLAAKVHYNRVLFCEKLMFHKKNQPGVPQLFSYYSLHMLDYYLTRAYLTRAVTSPTSDPGKGVLGVVSRVPCLVCSVSELSGLLQGISCSHSSENQIQIGTCFNVTKLWSDHEQCHL